MIDNGFGIQEEGVIEIDLGKYIIRTQDEAVRQLASQQIVAIFQGESEIGPRALGNRSLLFDPTNPMAKEIVNEIKEREEFRPFAGSMLLEYFDKYFITSTLKESPYMSYAIPVKKERVQEISSIVHHDYTCRIQTVTEEQNKNYYNLIKAWHKESGCPIVFNTSFNLGGEAMVETIEDAIDTCKRSMINFIYIPEDQDIDVQQYQVSEEELKKLQTELEESVSEEDDTQVKLSADKGAFINS
jgi:carbamoyltransferase